MCASFKLGITETQLKPRGHSIVMNLSPRNLSLYVFDVYVIVICNSLNVDLGAHLWVTEKFFASKTLIHQFWNSYLIFSHSHAHLSENYALLISPKITLVTGGPQMTHLLMYPKFSPYSFVRKYTLYSSVRKSPSLPMV